MIARILAAASLAGALAGCASDATQTAAIPAAPPSPQAAAAPAPASPAGPARAGGSLNGAYRGESRVTSSSGSCPQAGARTFAIRGGVLTVRWSPTTTLEAKVQPDGTFSTQAGATTMSGKVEGGQLEVDISNQRCGFHYSLKRV